MKLQLFFSSSSKSGNIYKTIVIKYIEQSILMLQNQCTICSNIIFFKFLGTVKEQTCAPPEAHLTVPVLHSFSQQSLKFHCEPCMNLAHLNILLSVLEPYSTLLEPDFSFETSFQPNRIMFQNEVVSPSIYRFTVEL